METLWNTFNGKKTNIAAAIAALSAIILGIGQIWEIQPEWYYRIAETLTYLAGVLGGGGLIHKAVKSRKK